MSNTPIAVEIDCSTGEVIERPFTQEEIEAHEFSKAQFLAWEEKQKADAAAKAAAKQSAQEKLKALGLTDSEILAITGI